MGCHISKSPENTNSVETNQESGTVLLVPAAARNALSAEKESGKLLLTHTLQEVMEINPEDVGDLEHAATKIQATFRGHVARKQAEKVKQETDLSKQLEKLDSKGSGDEELDVDLSDPNLNKAAVKIQASFRGHMARKEVMETIDKLPESNP